MTDPSEPESGSVSPTKKDFGEALPLESVLSSRRVNRRSLRDYPGWWAGLTAVMLAVAVVALVTIDLGPVVRSRAEQALAGYLDREISIGRIGVRLLPGQFLIENFVIAGLEPEDPPFLIAERITLSTTWSALLHGEFLAESVSMTNWQMVAESFPDGSQSFPEFVQQSRQGSSRTRGQGPNRVPVNADQATRRRLVATLKYLHATNGEFRYEDHGSDWSLVAPNLDLMITKVVDYRGHASFSGGVIKIKDFEPMWADMATDFQLDGPDVHLTRIDLVTDGTRSRLQGDVDLANFPEMTYRLESDIDFTRMREIFFADENFSASGEGEFDGTFHKFEGGYDLQGTFTSEIAGINAFRFEELEGRLLWQRDRFQVWEVAARPYGGQAWWDFTMEPLGGSLPGQATFEFRYQDVQLGQLLQALELPGFRPIAKASGRNVLEWNLGEFADFRNEGSIRLDPPEGVRLATDQLPAHLSSEVQDRARRPPDLTTRDFSIGGELEYTAAGDWIELASGRIATPSTFITFYGRTSWGVDSRVPFKVVSRNWQESDRLMASVMTAVGASTNPFVVDGYGTLDGVMLGDVGAPRIEANFVGQQVRAWNVGWGAGAGQFVVEDSYLDVSGGVFRNGSAELQVDGLFALSGPRNGDAEEMNAIVKMASFPAVDIRAAFGLTEGYLVDGPVNGEVHLYGAYRRLFGFGRLGLVQPIAYGETFDSAVADLRFEGDGVRLNGLDIRKGEGIATGAAFIEWDASYSFNLDAQNFRIETLAILPALSQPPSGILEGTGSGVGYFDDPRYVVRGTIRDLFIGDEEIGQVTGRLDVRDGDLRLDVEVASSATAVSVSGHVALSKPYSADVSLRVTDSSLDPYVRMFMPAWSTRSDAVISGSMDLSGELEDWNKVGAVATLEQVNLSLLGYSMSNDGPIRLSLDRQIVQVEQFRLLGDGSAINLGGDVDLANDSLALMLQGDANLGILEDVFEDVRGSGGTEVQTEIIGSIRRPVLSGQATVSNGRLRHLALPHGLEEINGQLIFEPGAIRFDDMAALMGSGAVNIGGLVSLDGLQLGELGITATGQQLQLRYPEGFRSVVDAELVLRGSQNAPVLAGIVNVQDAELVDGFELSSELFGSGESEIQPENPAPAAPGLPLSFDVRIVAPSSLRMTTDMARVVSSAELTWRGTYAQPVLFGSVELERGEAFVDGNRYRLNHGAIGFTNLTEIEPFVDIEVETDVRVPGQTYRVTVRAAGTVDRLLPTLSSDPPLPEVDILSLLLGDQRDPQSADLRAARAPELAQQQRFQAGAARLLAGPLSSGVGRVVERSFGVDTFHITPSLDPSSQQSAQFNPTARVLIGKRISDRAHVTLSHALSGANRDIIVVLEYDQSDRLSWILSQNEDRTYALDVRVRHSF